MVYNAIHEFIHYIQPIKQGYRIDFLKVFSKYNPDHWFRMPITTHFSRRLMSKIINSLNTPLFPAPVFKFDKNDRDMLLLLITAIGFSVLTITVSINFVDAKSNHENGYGGNGYGGNGYGGNGYGGNGYGGNGYGGNGYGGPVIQEPVTTGNSQLDKAINKFYNCISKTHEDPPTVEKVDNCYYQTVGK
jgi:hypothetical protein